MAKSDSVYSEEHDMVNRSDDQQTKKEIKSLQEKMDLLLSNQAKKEQMNFVGGPIQEGPPKINEVDGLEGQEELCFINNNGSWYMKEPNFQYNNYQQRSYSNNRQGGYQQKQNTQQRSYQPRQNTPPGFNNNNNQSTQVQGSYSQAPASYTSVDAMFKKLLDFQAKNEKTMGYELKNIHSKIDGSYNELNNKIRHLVGEPVGEEKRTVKHGETAIPTKKSSFIPPPYEPKLPFPGRFKRQLLEKYKALFEKQMSEIQVTMPIIDAFMLVPQYNKFLKDVVATKKKEMEGMMILTHECNAIIQRLDVPRKLVDP
ncbi:PREDICTED: uncharacterized protein LOC106315112 [Brassica oleracea var. oleracea]|uniref:uncharacterized protein LOC106315112 n=1 Tax=Brassica oleracea var. oleracea TaxID=109376 RepID=UPI0006A6E590|nr:PREDICTED: uncharacterized protein LOC106315112 [Brassica oleracea var. oleracea]